MIYNKGFHTDHCSSSITGLPTLLIAGEASTEISLDVLLALLVRLTAQRLDFTVSLIHHNPTFPSSSNSFFYSFYCGPFTYLVSFSPLVFLSLILQASLFFAAVTPCSLHSLNPSTQLHHPRSIHQLFYIILTLEVSISRR